MQGNGDEPHHKDDAFENSVSSIEGALKLLQHPEWVQYATPAWIEHIPFAFWLIIQLKPRQFVELGTHYGNSYFAFCQAVSKAALSTRCYAVDTWQGDEHAGRYDSTVFDAVHAYNQSRYGVFSELIRSTFDDAQRHFEDASIDLLHIDGLHTYDAVKHDFESWLGKMSDHGVILFHDTNVRERHFGVFQLWSELSAKYPSFEFLHGHGLGVLGVGKSFGGSVHALFSAAQHQASAKTVRELFWSAGGSLRAGKALYAQKAAVERLGAVLSAKENEIAQCRLEIDGLRAREIEASAHVARISEQHGAAVSAATQFRAMFRRERTRSMSSIAADRFSRVAINANMRDAGCQPLRQLEAIEYPTIWRSSGGASCFCIARRYPEGFLRVQFEAEFFGDGPWEERHWQLSIDYGGGKGEEITMKWMGDRISVDQLIKLSGSISRIRISPSDQPGIFLIRRFALDSESAPKTLKFTRVLGRFRGHFLR